MKRRVYVVTGQDGDIVIYGALNRAVNEVCRRAGSLLLTTDEAVAVRVNNEAEIRPVSDAESADAISLALRERVRERGWCHLEVVDTDGGRVDEFSVDREYVR
jgi:hypothetical protein